ncbi:hypothetical protein GGR54DRAFT_523929 [Hypoxylon sp. NC1633]|nr:hypothetical protein GGR54DRAFT_523929 [Hypoxylon sp. NC1633]
MVEVMRVPSLGQNLSSGSPDMMEMSSRFLNMDLGPASESSVVVLQQQQQQKGSSKEAGPKHGGSRMPRRAFTSTDYPATVNAAIALQRQHQLLNSGTSTPRETAETDSYFTLNLQPQSPQPRAVSPVPNSHSPLPTNLAQLKRPALPGPLRSYSVTDVEPVPFTQQPGIALTLEDLPPELHYAVFDFLDPIDSTCLGLTSTHFYDIHRRMHGTVSLSARREGPNDMEWVWRNTFISGPFVAAGSGTDKQNTLATLSPRGQIYCRKCRTARCELHNHIREWVGSDVEYCNVSQKFGPAAPANARAGYCYRSSPRHPHRCGRHTRQQRAVRLS